MAHFYLEEVATKQTHALIDICMWVYHFRLLNARQHCPISAFCGLDFKANLSSNLVLYPTAALIHVTKVTGRPGYQV